MQLAVSKATFWLEKTNWLQWVKLVMLPFAVWFIYYFINSDILTTTFVRVVFALIIVFSLFYIAERLSLWLSKLGGEQCLIAAFDSTKLHFSLDVQADFPVSTLLAVSFSESTIFNLIRWPGKKNVIKVITAKGISELPTNFSYAPLQTFLQQVNETIQK